MGTIHYLKILGLGVVIEILGVLTLVLLVAVSGPVDAEAAQATAERLGLWVGPVTGFLYPGDGMLLNKVLLKLTRLVIGSLKGSQVASSPSLYPGNSQRRSR